MIDRVIELKTRIATAQRLIDKRLEGLMYESTDEDWDTLERAQKRVDGWAEDLRELEGK